MHYSLTCWKTTWPKFWNKLQFPFNRRLYEVMGWPVKTFYVSRWLKLSSETKPKDKLVHEADTGGWLLVPKPWFQFLVCILQTYWFKKKKPSYVLYEVSLKTSTFGAELVESLFSEQEAMVWSPSSANNTSHTMVLHAYHLARKR